MEESSFEDLHQLHANDLLRIIFSNQNASIRKKAIEIIGQRQEQRALTALIQVMNTDKDLLVRMQAIESLKDLQDLRAFDSLALLAQNYTTPPELAAIAASNIFALDLKRAIDIGMDVLHNSSDDRLCVLIAILDSLQHYMPKIHPKVCTQIRKKLEALFDNPMTTKFWNFALTLSKTAVLYNSVLGLKFLLFYKEKLMTATKQQPSYYLESIKLALDELKAYNSLATMAPDIALYHIIISRNQASES